MILKDNNDFKNYQKELMQKNDRTKKRIKICMTGCKAYGADKLKNTLSEELKNQGINIEIVETGCQLFCSRAPVLTIEPEEIFYQQVRPEDVKKIINLTIKEGKIIDSLLYCNFKRKEEIEFFKRQKKFVLRNCGKIDPKRINHYILRDGYSALVKVLENIKPEEVIEEVKRSRLRGRGGAGFPTGLKWQLCRQQVLGNRQQTADTNASSLVPRAYIICNGDEGDPGAFMDRAVLEGDPHSVIEGMLIGAYAIGANEGYIYVRAEYPIAVKHLNIAVKQCEELGLLGKNILSSGFDFNIHIKEGAGAFVCGEETALIASLEGKRGMPRPRPPFPVEYGLFGKPTCINNVETLANIPNIILRGYGEYINIGTEKSGGTKVFSLAGKINNTGLVEVPIGMQLGEIIYEVGGGILKGRDFKAVQTGGPSGGCIPKQYLNLPVDYESLTQIGSIMGSGGMIVVDENTCMVELARYFLSFTQSESCGKCPPCRIGTKRMLEILTRITEGKGEPDDIEKLLELGAFVKDASLCGLGQTAPNPVLSTIKFFRDEYETHIRRKYCPAAQCKELVLAPCNNSCPGGIDVSGYIQLIKERKFIDAYNLILESIPFPSVCGRVCYHPCETKCRRGEIDEPVGINNLKRFVSDYARKVQSLELKVKSLERKDKKVAIIGSGPAGLTCAYFLAKEGYPVTLFEKEEKLGGMLRYGIPEYRLPKKILDYEIKRILSEGIKVKTKKILGRNLQLDSLLKEYPAVFLAIGCSKSQKLNMPGENLQGVYSGIEFLHKINLGEKLNLGSKVIVVGGGNVAIDATRVARRLGNSVTICYRRTKEQMPAHIYEIEETEKEGVKFEYLLSPIEIKKTKSGFICKFEKMVLGDYDSSGRRRPVGKNEYVEMESSSVIVAIGQMVHLKELTGNELTINNLTGETNIKGLFAGGDCATGPDMVISAIGAGKRVTKSIIKYLQGEEMIIEIEKKRTISEEEYKKKEEPAEILRQNVECLTLKERLRSFKEVEKGLSLSQVIVEAKRCLQCHLER